MAYKYKRKEWKNGRWIYYYDRDLKKGYNIGSGVVNQTNKITDTYNSINKKSKSNWTHKEKEFMNNVDQFYKKHKNATKGSVDMYKDVKSLYKKAKSFTVKKENQPLKSINPNKSNIGLEYLNRKYRSNSSSKYIWPRKKTKNISPR